MMHTRFIPALSLTVTITALLALRAASASADAPSAEAPAEQVRPAGPAAVRHGRLAIARRALPSGDAPHSALLHIADVWNTPRATHPDAVRALWAAGGRVVVEAGPDGLSVVFVAPYWRAQAATDAARAFDAVSQLALVGSAPNPRDVRPIPSEASRVWRAWTVAPGTPPASPVHTAMAWHTMHAVVQPALGPTRLMPRVATPVKTERADAAHSDRVVWGQTVPAAAWWTPAERRAVAALIAGALDGADLGPTAVGLTMLGGSGVLWAAFERAPSPAALESALDALWKSRALKRAWRTHLAEAEAAGALGADHAVRAALDAGHAHLAGQIAPRGPLDITTLHLWIVPSLWRAGQPDAGTDAATVQGTPARN